MSETPSVSKRPVSSPHSGQDVIREALTTAWPAKYEQIRPQALAALDSLVEQLEALRFSAARYHETQNEVNALAQQLASEWGWPDRESVLQRLRGDQTAARTTFTEDAYRAFLGVSNPAKSPEGAGIHGGQAASRARYEASRQAPPSPREGGEPPRPLPEDSNQESKPE